MKQWPALQSIKVSECCYIHITPPTPFAEVSEGAALKWKFDERWAPAMNKQTLELGLDEWCGRHAWKNSTVVSTDYFPFSWFQQGSRGGGGGGASFKKAVCSIPIQGPCPPRPLRGYDQGIVANTVQMYLKECRTGKLMASNTWSGAPRSFRSMMKKRW
jgi:hypothetical protein